MQVSGHQGTCPLIGRQIRALDVELAGAPPLNMGHEVGEGEGRRVPARAYELLLCWRTRHGATCTFEYSDPCRYLAQDTTSV